jgi:hypothetical protein
MAPETPTVRQLTHRLLDRAGGSDDAADAGAAVALDACERVCRELSRWVGTNGCSALLARAIADARVGHPVLEEIRIADRSEPGLEGVPEGVRKHGAAATAEGLEMLLVTLLELLGRLIGDDMVMRLVEQVEQDRTPDDPPARARRAES